MTQKGLWGRYIQYQWKNVNPVSASTVEYWLRDARFGRVQCMPLHGNMISGIGSVAMIAHKAGNDA